MSNASSTCKAEVLENCCLTQDGGRNSITRENWKVKGGLHETVGAACGSVSITEEGLYRNHSVTWADSLNSLHINQNIPWTVSLNIHSHQKAN